jgi:hypothetical protein
MGNNEPISQVTGMNGMDIIVSPSPSRSEIVGTPGQSKVRLPIQTRDVSSE